MTAGLALDEFLEYTDWEREKWEDWLGKQGDQVLETSTGPNCDERFKAIGEVIRHVFSAEKRYVDRLKDRPLSDTGSLPADNLKALFAFGRESRRGLREFVETFPAEQWDVLKEFDFFGSTLRATPRKIIVHILMHEIRHWAQIATLFRLNGLRDKLHDFLFSPVLGGALIREPGKASA